MSSTNKTEKLGLNGWIGSDIPQRNDFNRDNAIVDEIVGNHIDDRVIHVSESERKIWSNNVYTTFYFGNGDMTQTIKTGCPFEPMLAIIFANGLPTIRPHISGNESWHYFGIATPASESMGLSFINETDLQVQQSKQAYIYTDYSYLNANGVLYTVAMFR